MKALLAAGAPMRPAPAPRLLAVLLALLPLVAGCTIEPPVVQGTLPTGPPQAALPDAGGPLAPTAPAFDPNLTTDAILLGAPVWVRGDTWKWSLSAPSGSNSQQLVVVGETATDYLLATTDPDDAVATAFTGRSLPGRVSKVFLSGYDQGFPTRYFDFPLQTNKTWSLHIRGLDFAVKANFSRAVDPGRGPGFVIEGQAPSGDRVSLTYAPSAKWMTRFQLTDPAGGNVFQRTLTVHAANYTGPAYTAQVEDLYAAARNGTAANGPPVESFSQGRDYDRLHVRVEARGTGLADLRLVDPAGQVQLTFTLPPSGGAQVMDADLPSAPGAWHATWAVAGPVDLAVRVAGVDLAETQL